MSQAGCSKPFILAKVSIVSAQNPNGILTLSGLADTVKSGVVARTGLVKPTIPNAISVNSMITIVPQPKLFWKPPAS